MLAAAAPRERPELPWRASHVAMSAAGLAVGGVLVLVAWFGASGETHLSTEIAWTDLGVAGLILIAVTLGAWVLAGRRAVQARIERITATLAAPSSGPAPVTGPSRQPGGSLVSAPGMTRYHLASCQLVTGKRVRVATEAAHRRAKRRPCGVCLEGQRA